MSYEICKSITLTKDKEVYITSRCNNVRPSVYERWKSGIWSEMYKEKGMQAVLCSIGESVWEGNLQMIDGNGSKIVELYKRAMRKVPKNFHWNSILTSTMGEFLGKAVMKYLNNPDVWLVEEIAELIRLQSSKEYIEKAAKEGLCIVNYINNPELVEDKEFNLKIVDLCSSHVRFEMPFYFRNDKDIALAAIKKNGCAYRSLGSEMLGDKDVIEEAFRYNTDRHYNEHLIDLIPESVLKKDGVWNEEYICHLLEICPVMHLERNKELLKSRKIVLKWCQTSQFFLRIPCYLNDEFLKDPEIYNTLLNRCQSDEDKEMMKAKFPDKED